MKIVSELLGHSKIAVTEKHYAFLFQSTKDDALEKVFDKVEPKTEPKEEIPVFQASRLVELMRKTLEDHPEIQPSPELLAEMEKVEAFPKEYPVEIAA